MQTQFETIYPQLANQKLYWLIPSTDNWSCCFSYLLRWAHDQLCFFWNSFLVPAVKVEAPTCWWLKLNTSWTRPPTSLCSGPVGEVKLFFFMVRMNSGKQKYKFTFDLWLIFATTIMIPDQFDRFLAQKHILNPSFRCSTRQKCHKDLSCWSAEMFAGFTGN